MAVIKLNIIIQYCIPQKIFSWAWGILAELEKPLWFKNWAIKHFIKKYQVNMQEALEPVSENYVTFNQFFTRKLKPQARPIGTGIISPADGVISEFGDILDQTLIQAKNHYFNLMDLLGGDSNLANLFKNGRFMTVYLSPKDYHRVHMPVSGKLEKSLLIPGKLFSVNYNTTQAVPNLFSRNERMINILDNLDYGKFAVILVGAMIVGSIIISAEKNKLLEQSSELGYFKLGSTVILLFQENKINWNDLLKSGFFIKMGENIGA